MTPERTATLTARENKLRGLMDALRAYGEITQDQAGRAAGRRYGARLCELRERGWTIETLPQGRGVFHYRLLAEPGEALPATDQRGQCLLFTELAA